MDMMKITLKAFIRLKIQSILTCIETIRMRASMKDAWCEIACVHDILRCMILYGGYHISYCIPV